MTIRSYKSSDYEAIIANEKLADMYDETWDSRANYEHLARMNPTNILVAEIDNKIVSSQIIVPLGPDLAVLYRLNVLEKFRGQGIGDKMLEHAEIVAKNRGIKELGMYVDSTKSDLIKYYGKRNYKANSSVSYSYLWKNIAD